MTPERDYDPVDLTSEDEAESLPYGDHLDWTDWLGANLALFQYGRIRENDPAFFKFLTDNKVLHQAQLYLRKLGCVPLPGEVPSKSYTIPREEFIRNVNEVRISKGKSPLRVFNRKTGLELRIK